MNDHDDGQEYQKLRRERNKYKRLYFRYVAKKSKNRNNQKNSNLQKDNSKTEKNNDINNQNNFYEEENELEFSDSDEEIEKDHFSDDDINSDYEYDEYNDEDKNDDDIDTSILDLDNEELKDFIILDILNNYGRGHGARYHDETKIYSYELFSKSPSAYKFLRK